MRHDLRRRLVLVALSLAPAACTRRDAPAPAGSSAAPTGSGTVVLALVAPAGPAPFSVAAARQPDDEARFPTKVAALAWETRVYEAPSSASKLVGYVRAGGVVRAATEATGGDGCRGEWRAISPAGYVCLEPGNATTDLDRPTVHALARRADLGGRLPYMYGIVRRQGPIYARLPTRAEAEGAELFLDDHMRTWLTASGDDGAGFRAGDWLHGTADEPSPAALWEARTTEGVPDWLAGGKFPPGNLSGLRHGEDLVVGATKNHNAFALLDTAVFEGRRYGITTDLLVYPVDRMRPIEGSAFAGYRIPEDVDFPFALVRREGAGAYAMHGKKLSKAHDVARRSAIRLSGQQRSVDGVLYFQAADGLWLSERYVSRIAGKKNMPKWANEGERWIDVSIAKQALIAYEGTKAVYATLVSTGEAGLEDPATSKSTVRGIFRINMKHLTTTMNSTVVGEEFELKDIPYVQYFEEGYALHAAYWHDDFGIPRSHGCINLSPADAKWLFQWTLPQLPRGWHGVRSALSGSVVFIH
ncbi:MAG: L,D-transpeptidase [Polyangiaceae bacterium]